MEKVDEIRKQVGRSKVTFAFSVEIQKTAIKWHQTASSRSHREWHEDSCPQMCSLPPPRKNIRNTILQLSVAICIVTCTSAAVVTQNSSLSPLKFLPSPKNVTGHVLAVSENYTA